MKLISLSQLCTKAGIPKYSAPNIEKYYGVKPHTISGRNIFYTIKDIKTVKAKKKPIDVARRTREGEEAKMLAVLEAMIGKADVIISLLTTLVINTGAKDSATPPQQ